MSTPLSRRTLLGAGGGVGAMAALSGCSPVTQSALLGTDVPDDIVKYWNFFGGGDGARMQEMVADYRREFPEITLRDTTFAWGNPYYTKLTLGVLSRQPSHVASIHLDRMVTPVATNLLRPFSPAELDEWGLTADKFFEPAWERVQFDGQVYGIPLDYHPLAVYYNKTIAGQAGLLAADGTLAEPVGTQGFEAMLTAAKEVLGAIPTGIANDAVGFYRVFYTLHTQLGGELVSDDGREALLTRDVFVEVVSWLRSLTHEKELLSRNIDSSGAVANFANGDYAFFISGGWERPTFVDAGVDFGLHAFPRVYDTHVAWDGTHCFAIPRLDDETPERARAALHFITGMLDRAQTWTEGGHLTTWLPVGDDPAALAAVQPHYENLPADGSLYDPRVWYAGSGSNLQAAVGAPIAACASGFLSVEQAYDSALANLTELATTEPPT